MIFFFNKTKSEKEKEIYKYWILENLVKMNRCKRFIYF